MSYSKRLLRVSTVLLALLGAAAAGFAQDGAATGESTAAATGGQTAEERHDALLATAREEGGDFETALAEAREAGLPDSWLLEARLLRSLAQGELEPLMAMIPELQDVGEDFRFGIGRTFISEMQLEGFVDTLKSVQAYQRGNMEEFADLAVSSYRKAPDFNKGFGIGDLLANYRYQQVQETAASDMSVPMDMEFTNVEGETKSLKQWMGDKELALLDFWASWCGPCLRLMPELKEKAATLPEQGVYVAAVNTDQGDQMAAAKKVREQRDMESVPWLLDPNGSKLSSHLMIDSIPRMVLVDREGNILYNGHPMDPSLGEALAKVGVELKAEG